VLSYDGFVQHGRTITEPISLRDPLYFAFDLFDLKRTAFKNVIDNNKIRNRDSRELEATVAAMLSLVGFRLITVDRIPDLQEVPDIVAADPNGNLLLVECTLNLPRADDKLDKISRRFRTVRDALDNAGFETTRVLPVLAVALPTEAVSRYRGDAQKAQVLLWSRKELHELRQWTHTHTSFEVFEIIAHQYELMNLYDSLEMSASNGHSNGT
jgi:SepF-like predicted cell division protein (DUF552 family)